MGYKVLLGAKPKYKGCKELIPGKIYEDNKGEKLLFVGFGSLKRADEDFGVSWGLFEGFIYMKVDQIEKKIKNGLLSYDLTAYTGESELLNLFYFSQKPRLLVKELNEMFPSDYFENFVANQEYQVKLPDGSVSPLKTSVIVEVTPTSAYSTMPVEVVKI